MKKSWKVKYFNTNGYKIESLDKDYSDMRQGEKMLIATPLMIAAYIQSIPSGIIRDAKTIRKDLALKYDADNTCPLTYGIFLRIVSEYHYELYMQDNGTDNVVPFWRAISPKSPLLKKLTFDAQFIVDRQNEEKYG